MSMSHHHPHSHAHPHPHGHARRSFLKESAARVEHSFLTPEQKQKVLSKNLESRLAKVQKPRRV
jgi:hypothetical protein